MAFVFQFGIPPRTAGTRTVLGRLRGGDGTITPQDDTPKAEYDKVTGFSPRDPQHVVTGEYDIELDETVVSYVRAFASYPSRVLATESDPALVAKIRGPISEDEEGNPVFPEVRIVARPLSCALDYQYTGPAHSPIGDGLDTLWKFQGDPALTFEQNQDAARAAYVEYGSTKTLVQTNYWRAEDVPEGHTPPWTAPTASEYDFQTFPRHPSAEGSYDWQKYETWDLRYRLPSWYGTEQGDILAAFAGTYWDLYYQALTPTWPADTNPFFSNWLVPVSPGFRLIGGAGTVPHITVPTGAGAQAGITAAVQTLTTAENLEFTEDIRKLYPFSYAVAANNDSAVYSWPYFLVYDNKSPELWGTAYEVPWFNNVNLFKAYATWTLEVTADNCCWCSGYTIKGKVKFKKYLFDTVTEGAVGRAEPWAILNPGRPGFTSIGTVGATIWPGMRFRVQQDGEGNDLPPTDAGELDWEVTINETTATGSPYKFLNFFCFETTMVDGSPVVTPPIDDLVYVSDFYITEITPPAP